jgi:acetyl-CoA carboxylase carboxyltransferase component
VGGGERGARAAAGARARDGRDRGGREAAFGRGLTVRERIERLADANSFTEVGTLAQYRVIDADSNPGKGIPSSFVCGLAKVYGRPVAIGGEDWTSSRRRWTDAKRIGEKPRIRRRLSDGTVGH